MPEKRKSCSKKSVAGPFENESGVDGRRVYQLSPSLIILAISVITIILVSGLGYLHLFLESYRKEAETAIFLSLGGLVLLVIMWLVVLVIIRSYLKERYLAEEGLRNTAERSLRNAETRFRNVFDQAYQFSVLMDLEGNVTEVNDLCYTGTGLTEQQVIGCAFHELGWWKDDEQIRQECKEDIQTALNGEIARRNTVFINADNEERIADRTVSAVYDEEGKMIFLLAQGLDITESVLAQEALKDSENQLLSIANYTYDWESWFSPKGDLNWVNPAVEKLTGYSVEDCREMGDYPLSIVHEDDRAEFGELLTKGIHEQTSINDAEFRIRHKQGHVKWMAVSWQPIYDGHGNNTGLRTSVRDITERKKAQQQREELLGMLEFRNRELQDIVYTASHDLRSPLVNIEGFSAMLEEDCRSLLEIIEESGGEGKGDRIEPIIRDSIPEDLKFIKGGARKMTSLLDGLLQVSRIGTVEIHPESLDMNRIVGEVVSSMRHQMTECDISVDVGTLPGCYADTHLIDHVFTNLISNAIKYRDPEKKCMIKITGLREDFSSVYCVEDNGVGIDPCHQKKVFEIFHRLNPDGPVKGEGLGLTIVMRIIDRLGGKIWVESEPGIGTKFYISLPEGSYPG